MKCNTEEIHFTNDNEVNSALNGFWDLDTMGIEP